MLTAAPDNTLVIIPALNEEESLPDVIARLQAQGLTRIRVVDNGSTDDTIRVAQEAGADIVLESRRGYGQACWTGLQNLPDDVEWILFCDADGSDDIEALNDFFQASADHDLILANRQATPEGCSHLTWPQHFGSLLAGTLIGLTWGRFFRDLGPLRLIRRRALDRIGMRDRGFGWTVEMQARAAALQLRTVELPTRYHARRGGTSKISGNLKASIRAGIIILATLGKLATRQAVRSPVLGGGLILAGSLALLPYSDLLTPGVVPSFLLACSVIGLGWFLGLRSSSVSWKLFWGVAIGARLILLAAAPGDDIWRYLWEGTIQNHGFSPYHLAPDAPPLAPLRTDYWQLINHPSVATVYPPVAEWIFRLAAAIHPSVLFFKLVFTLADLAICALLLRAFGNRRALMYAWNPAVLISFAAGGHYDSLFLLPLVMAWLLPRWRGGGNPTSNLLLRSLLVGFSIAIKWMSLPAALYLAWTGWRRLGWKPALLSVGVTAAPTFIGIVWFGAVSGWTLPAFPTEFAGVARSSEFLPWLVSHVWEGSIRQNGLFALPVALVGFLALFRSRSLGSYMETYWIALLLCAPAFHHWYATWLIVFATASRHPGALMFSITSFLYFLQPHRYRLFGDIDPLAWNLTLPERLLLWAPLLLGTLYVLRLHLSHRQPSLLLMLKAPTPGTVKTRLAADVGEASATRLYRSLASRQLDALPPNWRAEVHYHPPGMETPMRAWLGEGPDYLPQSAGPLGQKLIQALKAPRPSRGPVFFVGGDCPGLNRSRLEDAHQALHDHDVVLIPATDGGYVLIGMKKEHPLLFDKIDWSTPRVLDQTLQNARQSGLRVALLEPLTDIDDRPSWQSAFACGDLPDPPPASIRPGEKNAITPNS